MYVHVYTYIYICINTEIQLPLMSSAPSIRKSELQNCAADLRMQRATLSLSHDRKEKESTSGKVPTAMLAALRSPYA